jgi:hypothetical protein
MEVSQKILGKAINKEGDSTGTFMSFPTITPEIDFTLCSLWKSHDI